MSVSGLNNPQFKSDMPFKDSMAKGAVVITKPIEQVENIVNNTVDTFVPQSQNEETKKSHKTAIKVVSTVLVLSAIIPFLNPKFSSKLINKMKTASAKYKAQGKNSNSIMGKIYRTGEKILYEGAKILNFTNNYNPMKDEGFKWLCNKSKFLKKPHEVITKWFDNISKQTVYRKYMKATESANVLENTILQYAEKLPQNEKAQIKILLEQAKNKGSYFEKTNIGHRLKEQENLMSNLEKDTVQKMKEYALGYKKDGRWKHFKNNLSFWAEDIMMPKRNKLEKDGIEVVNTLTGNGKEQKGIYNEIFDIISPHIKEEEKSALEGMIKKTSKQLHSANRSECIEYFDKKRDLMLGSAPTDVLTGLIGLGASGIAIGSADNKEDRVSRAVTVAFPAIAGLGVSMGMTAMLYSGIKGMLIGAASSGLLSLTGSTIDKTFIKNNSKKEVKNA